MVKSDQEKKSNDEDFNEKNNELGNNLSNTLSKEFYKGMHKSASSIINSLNNYSKSEILQNHYCDVFESIFYSKIINSFFLSLNPQNMRECGLSPQKIPEIKHKYENPHNNTNLVVLKGYEFKNINEKYYHDFKFQIEREFPGLEKLILAIENTVDMDKGKDYLISKKKEIKNSGNTNYNNTILVNAIEIYISQKNYSPIVDENFIQSLKITTKKKIPELSEKKLKNLKLNLKEIINEKPYPKEEFEAKLYEKWEEPLDLLECLIKLSFDSGKRHTNNQANTPHGVDFKLEALKQIHARALQISNEILVLLKAGYPDGANARWRSLHELAVISLFLSKHDENVSKRYLEYRTINFFKDAHDYQEYHEKLGYPPIKNSDYETIAKEKEKLCTEYGNDFSRNYGWIPSDIMTVRNFKDFEMKVEDMDAWRPFYNRSSASIHGNPSGFKRMGLNSNQQYKILLTGPSDFGLDMPIQTTAISLMHVSNSLLNTRPDLECIGDTHLIKGLVEQIDSKSSKIRLALEK